jgi:hypothetical protein
MQEGDAGTKSLYIPPIRPLSAIPPSAGQGISQAFEDIYMFALLLA